MSTPLILINAGNLHVGGGVQVAISFIFELSILKADSLSDVDVIVSSEVDEGLERLECNKSVFRSYKVLDLLGLSAFFSPLNKQIKNYKLVFTVFGPNYLKKRALVEVVGFAQAWILEFNNPVSHRMNCFRRLFLRFKFFLQWLFFKRANHFFVELEHVKKKLICKGFSKSSVTVVHNCFSSIYLEPTLWDAKSIDIIGNCVSLGIVSRDYQHKNIDILPMVKSILKERFGLSVNFFVTFNSTEWESKTEQFRSAVVNVGSLLPTECPSFYLQMDGIIFPSLLECFSATPLEALVMQKPLFASDRGFVRDVCEDHAFYFDPLDIESIASTIAEYFSADIDRTEQLKAGREHAISFSSARKRAVKYLEIIKKLSNG